MQIGAEILPVRPRNSKTILALNIRKASNHYLMLLRLNCDHLLVVDLVFCHDLAI